MDHNLKELIEQISELIDIAVDRLDDAAWELWGWLKGHQVGIYTTTIFYLLLAITIMTVKITTNPVQRPQSIEIEMELIEEVMEEEKVIQQQIEEEQAREEVRNIASNMNSTSAERSARRGQHSSFDDLIEQAAERRSQMDENRDAYERGLKEADFIRHDRRAYERSGDEAGRGEEQERRDARVRGSVTVAYSITNPVRHAKYLAIPAYQCQGGGRVAINIIVNRSGNVISAKVASGGDKCMQDMAMAAALKSSFDINEKAPAKQPGMIYYTYVAQ